MGNWRYREVSGQCSHRHQICTPPILGLTMSSQPPSNRKTAMMSDFHELPLKTCLTFPDVVPFFEIDRNGRKCTIPFPYVFDVITTHYQPFIVQLSLSFLPFSYSGNTDNSGIQITFFGGHMITFYRHSQHPYGAYTLKMLCK